MRSQSCLISRCWSAVCALAVASAASAAAPFAATPAAAADPEVAVAAPAYHAAFAGYRSWRDGTLQSWQASNEAAWRGGGWRAYAREGSVRPEAAKPPTVAPATGTVNGGKRHAHH